MSAMVLRVGTRQGVAFCSRSRYAGSVLADLDQLSWGLRNRDPAGKMKAIVKQAPHSHDL